MDNSNKLWGITKIKTLDFSYTWTIHNFSLNDKEVNEPLWSPYFQVPGKDDIKWSLCLYPKGTEKDGKDYSNYICVYLHVYAVDRKVSPKLGSKISTKITFSILDGKNEEKNDCTISYIYKEELGHGLPAFINQSILLDPKNNLLPNDELTIVCKVTVGIKIENCSKDIVKFEEYQKKFTAVSDWESLFENKHMTDITLRAEGKELEGHKAVLAARSPVFLRMLQTHMKEKQSNIIEIDDVTYDVLSEMILYLYTGEVKDIKKYATDLVRMADKYDIKGLKLMCEEQFYNELSIQNAITLFILADRHNCDILRPLILKFIIAHAKDILKTVEFKKLEKDLPILIKEMIHAAL